MSLSKRNAFQLSIVTVAMLSLAACSTAPKIAGAGIETAATGIGKVSSKTAELGAGAWKGTKRLLNIDTDEAEPEFVDEVDLALMEDDDTIQGVLLASNDTQGLLPQGSDNLTLTDTFDDQSLLPQSQAAERAAVFGSVPNQQVAAAGDLVVHDETNSAQALEPLLDESVLTPLTPEIPELSDLDPTPSSVETVPSNDLIHVVSEAETLWVIAKQKTGDANNWHVIADINNLPPNASVFVGQKLVIPADMLKPVEAEPVIVAEEEAEQPVIEIVQPEAVAQVPEAPAAVEAETVVAAAEQLAPAASADAGNIMTDATAIKVASGETLWDFAKRTTGDATNWKLLADKNQFTEQQIAKIRPGQKIYVPSDMVRSRDENGVLIAKGAEGAIPTVSTEDAVTQNNEAIDASAAVLAGTNQPEGEIKIVEAAYQDGEGLTPVTAESLSEEAAMAVAENDSELGKVMVSGTYYPKAVYNQADFSSSLLMRVSPGTQLLVSKAVGPWLEVQTDKGVGYVHSRDIK